jgi:HK97 family phage major capsid protein
MEYSQDIIQGTIRESACLQLCRQTPMGSLIDNVPVMTALPTAGFVNPRDTGTKALTSAAWSAMVITAEELAAVIAVPQALVDDATFDIFGELQPRISEAMGSIIDAAILFGTNAPASWPAGGIYAAAEAADNRYVSGTGVDIAQDINNTMALVEADGFDVNGFVGAISLKAALRGLRATSSGVLLFQPSLQAGMPGTLYGENITYARNAAINTALAVLIMGDWSTAVIGMRQEIRIQMLDQAVFTNPDGTVAISLAEQDMVALRCYMRLGFGLANPATISQPGAQRTVADGATNTNTTVTSATAAFTAADRGVSISGVGIPANTTIASVTNATTVVLSAAATATATGVTLTIGYQRSSFAVLEPVGGPAH